MAFRLVILAWWLAGAAPLVADELRSVCDPVEATGVSEDSDVSVSILGLGPVDARKTRVRFRVDRSPQDGAGVLRATACLQFEDGPVRVLEESPTPGTEHETVFEVPEAAEGAPPLPGRYRATVQVWIEPEDGSPERWSDGSPQDDEDSAEFALPSGVLRIESMESFERTRSVTGEAALAMGVGAGSPTGALGSVPGGAATSLPRDLPEPTAIDLTDRYELTVVAAEALQEDDDTWEVIATIQNLGGKAAPAAPVSWWLDPGLDPRLKLEPLEPSTPELEPGDEVMVRARIDASGLGLEDREVAVGAAGGVSVTIDDADPADNSASWVFEFPAFGY